MVTLCFLSAIFLIRLNLSVSIMEKSSIQTNRNLSKTLLIFAWLVEAFAVTTGLFIAAMLGMETLDKIVATRPIDEQIIQASDYVNTLIAILPFVLVAVVELAKIPVAQAAYNTVNFFWKGVFFFTLLFLALITFETNFNGFERNFSNLTFTINKFKDELEATQEKINELSRQKVIAEELNAEDIENAYNARRIELIASRDKEIGDIRENIAELRASVNNATTDALRERLVTLNNDLQRLRDERDANIAREIDRIDNLIDDTTSEVSSTKASLEKNIRRVEETISKERDNMRNEIDNSGIFDSESKIRERYNSIISQLITEKEQYVSQLQSLSVASSQAQLQNELDKKIEQINSKFESRSTKLNSEIRLLNDEIAKSIALVEGDIQSSLVIFQNQQNTTQEKFEKQLLANSDNRKRMLLKLENSQNVVDKLNFEITALNDIKVELRNTINQEVGNNQIYRMTRSWTGADSAADISRKDISITGAIWFGSLAAIVALTGILLALASCVLNDESKKSPDELKRVSRFNVFIMLRTLRNIAASILNRLRKPKLKYIEIEKPIVQEVVKEVPVEKVAIKEVPRDVVRNRIVHIPIYTNDKSLLNTESDVVEDKE